MAALIVEFIQSNRLYFFFSFLLVLIISFEVGLWTGNKRRKEIGENRDDGATLVIGSLLGLLAFVLALNLSTASSRFEMRNTAALNEVNAIGTAILQAQAVGGDQSDQLVEDLKQYLVARYKYVRSRNEEERLAALNQESDIEQGKIWQTLSARIQAEPTPAVTSLMNSLNNAYDASTNMRHAMEFRMPMQIMLLLLFMSSLGIAAVGYQFGLTERRGRAPGVVLLFLWCLIVTEIFDIGSARIWSFRTNTKVYEWQMQSLGIEIPPREVAR